MPGAAAWGGPLRGVRPLARGPVVREAKAFVPSAWSWAHPGTGKDDASAAGLIALGGFPIARARSASCRTRRLDHPPPGADSRKLDLGDDDSLPSANMLGAMGRDLGALHAGSVSTIRADLARRPDLWLRRESKTAAEWVEDEFKSLPG